MIEDTTQRTKRIRLGYLQGKKSEEGDLDIYGAAGVSEDTERTLRFDNFEDTYLTGEDGRTPGEGTKIRSHAVVDSGWVRGGEEQEVRYDRGRTAIGIRDVAFSESTYSESAVLVTKTYNTVRDIASLQITADEYAPASFPAGDRYIKYEVSFNGGSFAEIIPDNVGHKDKTKLKLEPEPEVRSFRLKITLSRPLDSRTSTPVLKGYKLKVELKPE